MSIGIYVWLVLITLSILCLAFLVWYQMRRFDDLLKQNQSPPTPKRRKHGRSPALSATDMDDIVKLIDTGYTKTEIAEMYEVSRQTLYKSLNRRTNG